MHIIYIHILTRSAEYLSRNLTLRQKRRVIKRVHCRLHFVLITLCYYI